MHHNKTFIDRLIINMVLNETTVYRETTWSCKKQKRLDSGGRTRNKTVGLNQFLVERPDLNWVQNVDHLSLGPFGEWTARELR